MPRFLIERTLPDAGRLSPQQLHDVAQKSNDVLGTMQRQGTPIQWLETYVTADALNCVYLAPNAEAIREHARAGGFPCDGVREISTIIDPTTGE